MGVIVTEAELGRISKKLRDAGQKLVLTNGCFDLLHVGHVRYLRAARELGDCLAVGLNSDSSVRALKGADRPVNSEKDRGEVLAALACIDYVTIFSDLRATGLITAVQPAVYVKGGDYTPETLDREERAAIEAIKAEIRIVSFHDGYSTTRMLRTVQDTTRAAEH